MAQTKRRRQTKHRGNAAGVVEARGRTGRKPTVAEKTGNQPREERASRLDRPPTWRGAFYRAMIAAVLMLLAGLFLLGKHGAQAIVLFPIVLAMYVPLSYYTDLWLYNRRMRARARKAQASR